MPVLFHRPLLIDLFCCEGGAAEGYHRAGFDVIGIDIEPQPRYPFSFIQADAVEWLRRKAHWAGGLAWWGTRRIDAFHASPPCQAWSDLQKQNKRDYPELIGPVRELLRELERPYVIENVEGAPLIDPVKVCGAGIAGLRVIRHRLFESNVPLVGVPCPKKHPLVFTHDKRKAHHGQLDQDASFVQVTGGGNSTIANKRSAMGTPWMSGHGCNEAIPPAYTEFIGLQLREHLYGTRLAEAA